MARYRYLLLDADGTLFDFKQAEGQALKRTLQHHQIAYDEQVRALYSRINQSLWEALEQNLMDKERLQSERFRQLLLQLGLSGSPEQLNATYLVELGSCPILIGGAEAVCRILAERYHLAIITNGIASVQRPRFIRSPLADIVRDLFISEEIGFEKPHANYFQHVLRKLEINDHREVLVIGDSLTADIAGGIKAGLDTCWYNPGHRPPDRAVTPTYEIDQLELLPDLLSDQAAPRP